MTNLSQKKNPWVVSSFDAILPDNAGEPKKRNLVVTTIAAKQKKHFAATTEKDSALPSGQTLWVEKHQPTNQDELAVHKKKIVDVQAWLEQQLMAKNKFSEMLLLTGPSGAGKTATLRCLAEQMHVEIHEWTNKPGLALLFDQTMYSESQISTFRNFLFRASKYSSNQIFGKTRECKKIILMEEFPTAILRDVTEFHNMLRQYHRVGRCPLAFVVTDSAKEDKNERNLFPKDFQHELNLTNISFNPVAPSKLFAAISRVANAQGLSLSKATADLLAENSHGDIRAAINALQFMFQQDSRIKTKKNTSKRSRWTKDQSMRQHSEQLAAVFGARDESLFLFHALGKILHCKRNLEQPISPRLPPEMRELERHTLLVDPEDVWSRTSTSANNFNAFLHQNYLPFFVSIESAGAAADYFSQADYFNGEWMGDSPMNPYIYSVAARGVLFGIKGKNQVGWKPLHKPTLFAVDKNHKEKSHSGREMFHGKYFHLAKEELFSQLIPYLTKIGQSGLTTDQDIFISSIGKIASTSKHRPRNRAELLEEKEVVEESCLELLSAHPAHDQFRLQPQLNFENEPMSVTSPMEQDEIDIEEYAD